MFYESKLNPCQQITSWSSDHTCRTCSDCHLCHLFVNICISYVATLIKIFTEQPLGHVAPTTLLCNENCRRWFSEYEIEWIFNTLDVNSVLWMLVLNLHNELLRVSCLPPPSRMSKFSTFRVLEENKVRSKCHTNMRFLAAWMSLERRGEISKWKSCYFSESSTRPYAHESFWKLLIGCAGGF